MHVALLRMQYVLPENHYIFEIWTTMRNKRPYNMTNLLMLYNCSLFEDFLNENDNKIESRCHTTLEAENLQELTEKVRTWSVSQKLKTVNKPVRKSDNSMTLPPN